MVKNIITTLAAIALLATPLVAEHKNDYEEYITKDRQTKLDRLEDHLERKQDQIDRIESRVERAETIADRKAAKGKDTSAQEKFISQQNSKKYTASMKEMTIEYDVKQKCRRLNIHGVSC